MILENPLGEAIIAGGLTQLNPSPQEVSNKENNHINLSPMTGGGLFKSVQAPLNPGEQNWAAIIAHPDGLIAVSKMVKIVSSGDEL